MDDLFQSPETHLSEDSEAERMAATRKVIPINADVRSFLALFLSLYDNYAQAAADLGIAKDTLARYFEGNPHLAHYVFERMAVIVESRCAETRIRDYLKGKSFDDLRALTTDCNSRELDRARYEMTRPLYRILRYYAEQYPNRSGAAAAISLNPRTLKAYLAGNIQSFPARLFENMIHALESKGHTLDAILAVAGVSDWNEVLPVKGSTDGRNIAADEIVAILADRLRSENPWNRRLSKPVYVAIRRFYGEIGAALKATILNLEEQFVRDYQRAIASGNEARAGTLAAEFEHVIATYAGWRSRLPSARDEEVLRLHRREVRRLRASADRLKSRKMMAAAAR